MWGSKGRSGYGDSTIGGDYDSWDGVSRNGRQYRNEITQETRDLSGADYWHLRKQNRPTEEIPAHLHMLNKDRANIDAYADKPVVNKSSKVSIKDRILPQFKRVQTLTAQMVELEAEYKSGAVDINEYTVLRSVLAQKRDRAVELYKLAINKGKTREKSLENSGKTSYANNVPPVDVSDIADEQSSSEYEELYDNSLPHLFQDVKKTNVFYGLVKFSVKCVNNACKAKEMLVEFKHKVSKYIDELKAV